MRLLRNATEKGILRLCDESRYHSAKWLEDIDTGETWWWVAEDYEHTDFAKKFEIENYTKGVCMYGATFQNACIDL